jgi:hypothetical protein
MPLSDADRAELDRLGADNVRLKLPFANPGDDMPVPGLGPGPGMRRKEVEDWLAEQTKAPAKLQLDTLRWAKAAT